jgi:hypothetical protein
MQKCIFLNTWKMMFRRSLYQDGDNVVETNSEYVHIDPQPPSEMLPPSLLHQFILMILRRKHSGQQKQERQNKKTEQGSLVFAGKSPASVIWISC